MTDEEVIKDSEEWLAPWKIQELIAQVRDGSGRRPEAEQLLKEFAKYGNSGRMPPPEILEWMTGSINEWQRGGKSLEQALSLMQLGAGFPGADEAQAEQIAIAILAARLAGKSHEGALDQVKKWCRASGWRRCGKTKLETAWKVHKGEAFHALTLERGEQGATWTEPERKTLLKIFDERKYPQIAQIVAGRASTIP